MDSDFARRAAERRKRLIGGVARSFDELERASQEFWENAPHAAKLRATHDALFEAWSLQGKNGPPPRFDGRTWGVLKFER